MRQVERDWYRFFYKDEQIYDNDTPSSLDIKHNDTIDAKIADFWRDF